MNGFLTTTTLRSTALKQAMKPLKQTDLIPVLLELQFNLQHLGNRVIVAETSQYNEISCEEQEDIICNSNVTFRLESVIMNEQMYLIKISASNEGHLIQEKYIKDSHRQMEDISIRILFGRLMCDMGQWDQSQHFFENLLNNLNYYNEDLAKIERSLDEVLQWKEAQKYYDRAYNRIMNTKSIRIKDLAYILFDIGELLHLQGRYEEAREYFE
ncbi:unnamed protein product [Rotaria sp. Silwood2]|nr:unnamed protein product [Rotaria sp. Silwood2]